MERLTRKDDGKPIGIKKCYEECLHPVSGCDCVFVREAWQKLAKIEDVFEKTGITLDQLQTLAEKQQKGLLVELPIKPNETVWVIVNGLYKVKTCSCCGDTQREYYTDVVEAQVGIVSVRENAYGNKECQFTIWFKSPQGNANELSYSVDEIGKTVFLTKQAAQEKLEG